MGNCCCRCSSSNQNPDHDPTPRAISRADLSSGPAGNATFGDENFSGNSWYSFVNTNLTTWTFQLSSSFTTIWGKNAVESSSVDEDFGNGIINTNSNLRAFTLAQLKSATYNFRPDMVVGRGGFGKVYRGWMKEKVPSKGIRKTAIAIKKLSLTSMQGYQEWMAEVTYLGRLSHPNLVKLLGYCKEDDQFLLVYEFMKNGSLNYCLFGKGSVRPLAWEIRLKVAMETARALAYLHTLEKPVIYRDFKSSNVLLDESFTAKVADFGLAFGEAAADGSHFASSVFTSSVVGTLGYSDPLYIATGHLTVKSDVYSYGVVLLEMLTGLQSVDNKRPRDKRVLVDWVKPYLSSRKKLKSIMDHRLEGRYPFKQASSIARLALRCIQPGSKLRPSMTEVAETLEQINSSSARPAEPKTLSNSRNER